MPQGATSCHAVNARVTESPDSRRDAKSRSPKPKIRIRDPTARKEASEARVRAQATQCPRPAIASAAASGLIALIMPDSIAPSGRTAR